MHPGALETEFALRLQQLTAPVMAKGVEDTACYRYQRLISLNEVGGSPGVFGRPVAAFHTDTAIAAAEWPDAMLTLSTHDTKRSGDVRARLNVLPDVADAWADAVTRWHEHNARQRRDSWPDANTEYLLYQTLVGAWPIAVDRVVAFLEKAMREAKVHTSWTEHVADYEDAVTTFARDVLADEWFVADVERFLTVERVIERGRRNSLAQTALLLTCPGVPDVYQGTELWDLSLVDPDNRRAVDYDVRRDALSIAHQNDAATVQSRDERGATKLWMMQRLLSHRGGDAWCDTAVPYEPLMLEGARTDDVVAFTYRDLAVVAPLHGDDKWGDTAVQLPAVEWRNLLADGSLKGGAQLVADLWRAFPVAVLARVSR
jgi:(1->4)-alpha-D-glucan 1-alpha-D-glucosylmutase